MNHIQGGKLPLTYVLAEQLANTVVEIHTLHYLQAHPTVSREDTESYWNINREIAASISRDEGFRKTAGSTVAAFHHLRTRYGRMGRERMQQLRRSMRENPSYNIEVNDMRERIADLFARKRYGRGRGDYITLYQEELDIQSRRPDRQIMGIYFTYFERDGTEKPENKPRERMLPLPFK